jgi:hypothetical protein
MKEVDPLMIIVSVSRIFLDFTLTLTEFFKPDLSLTPADPIRLFLTLALISNLSLTNKGRSILSKLFPTFEPKLLYSLIDPQLSIESQLQLYSLISRDIATKPSKLENMDVYMRVIDIVRKVLSEESPHRHVQEIRIDLIFEILSNLTLKADFKALIPVDVLNLILRMKRPEEVV